MSKTRNRFSLATSLGTTPKTPWLLFWVGVLILAAFLLIPVVIGVLKVVATIAMILFALYIVVRLVKRS